MQCDRLLDRDCVLGALYDPEHPLHGMYVAMTGETLAGVLSPGQAVSRMEALRMWTANNATAIRQEGDRGTLCPGKLADMVVLSGDFLNCPEDEFLDLVVDVTIVGGEVVYERQVSP